MKSILLVLVLFLCVVYTTNAQWVSNGPYGAVTSRVVAVGSDYYAATTAGIYKTTDNGATWIPVSKNLPADQPCYTLFYDGTTMYASLDNLGQRPQVYASSDMGVTWAPKSNGLKPFTFYLGFCSIADTVFVSEDEDVYFTTNSGNTWQPTASSPYNASNGKLFSKDHIMYAVHLFGKPLSRSLDRGQTWQTDTTGFGVSGYETVITDIFFKDNTIYAVGQYVFSSADKGATWTRLTDKSTIAAHRVAFDGTNFIVSQGGNGNVQVFKNTLGSPTWVNVLSDLPDGYTNYMFTMGTDIYIDKDGVLYKTSNAGGHWENTGNKGMLGKVMSSVFCNGSIVLGGTAPGAFKSTDDGSNWVPIGTNFEIYSTVKDFEMAEDTIIAALDGDGTYRSFNQGDTWVKAGLSGQYVQALTYSGGKLYATGSSGGNITVATSANKGKTWTGVGGVIGEGTALDILVLNNDLYMGCGVANFTDTPGVYKTQLTPVDWNPMGNGLRKYAVSTLAGIGNKIYAGTPGQGVFVSDDFAASWDSLGDGLKNLVVNDLLSCYGILAAATDSGVYLLQPGSTQWEPLNNGLFNYKINQLAYNGTYLFAATDASVWRIPLTQVGISNEMLAAKSYFDIYPNPANNELQIANYTRPNDGSVSREFERGAVIKITDVMGREVYSAPIQTSSLKLQTSSFASGLYVIQLITGCNTVAKKLVVQH